MRTKRPLPTDTAPFRTQEQWLAILTEKSRQTASGCVEWTGASTKEGYGCAGTHRNGKTKRYGVHRLSFFAHTGRFSALPVMICHTCDNRKCIRIDHLYEGNAKTNYQDRAERHVYKRPWKATNHHKLRKLSAKDASDICRLFWGKSGNFKRRTVNLACLPTPTQLSKETGLQPATIVRIIEGLPITPTHWKNHRDNPESVIQFIRLRVAKAQSANSNLSVWTISKIAEHYKMSFSSIRNIVYGKTYADWTKDIPKGRSQESSGFQVRQDS